MFHIFPHNHTFSQPLRQTLSMKNSRISKAARFACVVLLTTGVTANAWTQVASSPSKPTVKADSPASGERRLPPPESVAACSSLKADQACGFTSPKGAEKGTCVKQDAGQALACRPERSGPPAAAYAACKDKAINADCTASVPEGAAKGQCVQAPTGSALVCRPGPR